MDLPFVGAPPDGDGWTSQRQDWSLENAIQIGVRGEEKERGGEEKKKEKERKKE